MNLASIFVFFNLSCTTLGGWFQKLAVLIKIRNGFFDFSWELPSFEQSNSLLFI